MYSLLCFDSANNQFQALGATSELVFSTALSTGAVRVIDWTGSVFRAVNGKWEFSGPNVWTNAAGSRAGSQNFPLLTSLTDRGPV